MMQKNNLDNNNIQIDPPFHIHNEQIKVVDNFPYLGSIIPSMCSIVGEINSRISKASEAYLRLSQRVFNIHNHKAASKAAVYRAVSQRFLMGRKQGQFTNGTYEHWKLPLHSP